VGTSAVESLVNIFLHIIQEFYGRGADPQNAYQAGQDTSMSKAFDATINLKIQARNFGADTEQPSIQ